MGKRFLHSASLLKNISFETASHFSINSEARLPVMSYLLLLRLYGKELDPDQGFTIFQLKRRFCDQTWQE